MVRLRWLKQRFIGRESVLKSNEERKQNEMNNNLWTHDVYWSSSKLPLINGQSKRNL